MDHKALLVVLIFANPNPRVSVLRDVNRLYVTLYNRLDIDSLIFKTDQSGMFMDQNELVSHAFEMLTASAVFTTLAFGWIIWRSSSWHILKHRLWRLAFGKHEHIDKSLKACIDGQSNLTAFQFHFVRVTHWPHAQAIMKWAREKGVDLGSICACGGYFDFDSLVLKKPKFSTTRVGGICVAVASFGILAAVLAILFAASPRALVSFNNTDTWLLLGTTDAKVFGPSDAKFLTKDDCAKPQDDFASTRFSKEQVASLCQFFEKKTAAGYVGNNVKVQRMLSISFLLVIAWALAVARLSLRHTRAAWGLHAHLDMTRASKKPIDTPHPDKEYIGESENPLLRFGRTKRGGRRETAPVA